MRNWFLAMALALGIAHIMKKAEKEKPPGTWASPHFKWSEFKVSASRPDLARKIVLSGEDKVNIRRLCFTVLEPLRAFLGVPIKIISGKRSDELNAAIKGAVTSQHLFAEAADLGLPTQTNYRAAWPWLENNRHVLGQAIRYYETGVYRFIHVSIPETRSLYAGRQRRSHLGHMLTKTAAAGYKTFAKNLA